MGLAARRLLRDAWHSLGVVAVVGTIAFGLPAIDRAVPANRSVPLDRPYRVGGGIALVPPAGADLDVSRTRPRTDQGSVLFVIGGVKYAVVVSGWSGDLRDAERRLLRRLHDTAGYTASGPPRPVRTPPGLAGDLRCPYGRAGRYAVYLIGHRLVEATATGPAAALAVCLPAIDASLDTIRGA